MVTELHRRYDFDVETVKKPESHLLDRPSLPRFPALEIDETLIFEDRITTIDELEGELVRRGAPSRTQEA